MLKRNDCGPLIKQINDEMAKRANNLLRSNDLTMVQVVALSNLNLVPEKQMTLKELEHMLHVAQSTAAGIVVRLENKGLIESFRNPTDKRIKMVRITPAGEQCCRFADQCMEKTETQLLSGITEEEQIAFFKLLQKICSSIK